MRKFTHILALVILLIGSSFDTLELLLPAQSSCAPLEKNQHSKNSQRELVNDELIINRHANPLSASAYQKAHKQHPSFIAAGSCVLQQLQLPPPAALQAKQQPGYGTLFRYYLF